MIVLSAGYTPEITIILFHVLNDKMLFYFLVSIQIIGDNKTQNVWTAGSSSDNFNFIVL